MGLAVRHPSDPGLRSDCWECDTLVRRGPWQLRTKAFWPYSCFLVCSMDWRCEPIQRQTQKLKLKQRQRQGLRLKQTLTTLTTLEVKWVVKGITLEGKMVVRDIILEDKMEVRVHTLRILGCQVVMEGDCHLHTLPYNQAGPATSSP